MSFHLYKINELYSNTSGTLQFIEFSVGGSNNQSFWAGVNLSTTRSGVTNSFVFPTNLPSTATANTSVLIATQAFADLAQVTPDYILPDGFLFQAGGSLNFGGADIISYGPLPGDGSRSVNRSDVPAVATPKNFAGLTGPVPATVPGSEGADELTGTNQGELVEGLGGDDELHSGGGNDVLLGGAGDDRVFSGPGNDRLDGGEGYDYLDFNEAIAGVNVDGRSGLATGGAGNDRFTSFELIFGSAFNDTYVGNDESVGFLGLDGDDTLTGGAGRDHLEGNGGDDVLDGLDGVDSTAFYSADFAVDVNLTTGRASGGLGNDILRNIEDAVGSVYGDSFTGSAVDNRLEGADGDDTFFSTAGNDILQGDAGLDTAVYSLARSAYTLRDADTGIPVIEKPGAAGSDSLPGTERLQFSDIRLALDLDGAAGQVAKLLGVAFGAASLGNEIYVAIGLSYLDGGMSYEELAALAVGAAGATSHAAVVDLLWTHLFGSAPSTAQAAPFVAMLDGGTSVGALTVMAAETSFNADNIGLTGLAFTGIEYAL